MQEERQHLRVAPDMGSKAAAKEMGGRFRRQPRGRNGQEYNTAGGGPKERVLELIAARKASINDKECQLGVKSKSGAPTKETR